MRAGWGLYIEVGIEIEAREWGGGESESHLLKQLLWGAESGELP